VELLPLGGWGRRKRKTFPYNQAFNEIKVRGERNCKLVFWGWGGGRPEEKKKGNSTSPFSSISEEKDGNISDLGGENILEERSQLKIPRQ